MAKGYTSPSMAEYGNDGAGYPSRTPVRRVKRKGNPKILVDITSPPKPRPKLNTSVAYVERQGFEVGPSGKASKRDLSASWSKGKAKVLRRSEADKAPPGRDVSAFEPGYQ